MNCLNQVNPESPYRIFNIQLLMKPIKQSELLEAVALSLGALAKEPLRPGEPADALPPLPALRILLAEDSLVNQKLAVGLLEKHGHSVVVARNGKEAIGAWVAEPFDVVLMDVEMPEMDGFEATAVIRTQERQRGVHTPIIAMTAHAMKGDRQRCLDAGMDDYLSKPIRAGELFEKLRAALPNAPDQGSRADITA